jgi:uncharacterized protein (UPF0276 family)
VSRFAVPDLGVGVGFRVPHYGVVLNEHPAMDWFEVIAENFMLDGGPPLENLARLQAAYPVVPHGVSMSLGDAVNPDHQRRLLALLARLNPPWFSDHACWTGHAGVNTHDLLPLPYTDEVLAHVVDRIKQIQDRSGRLFAVENVSSYLSYRGSTMPEAEFMAALCERADCALLLDVNNVFVSAVNHGLEPALYINTLPLDRVVQVHLAGHSIRDGFRLDTHDHPVCDEVWALYAALIRQIGPVSTLIEWDDQIPSFERLRAEAEAARAVRDGASSP